jgi:3-methyladenine DNA glycosylase/8-oxoguanine DNA glycosylase
MRFSTLTFGLTALLAGFVAAAPTANSDTVKRMPTPEEFDALAPAEKRKVYTSWYRATNIIGVSDDV